MEWICLTVILKEASPLYSAGRPAGGMGKLRNTGKGIEVSVTATHLKKIQGDYLAALANDRGEVQLLGPLTPTAEGYEGHFESSLTPTAGMSLAVLAEEYGTRQLALTGSRNMKGEKDLFASLPERKKPQNTPPLEEKIPRKVREEQAPVSAEEPVGEEALSKEQIPPKEEALPPSAEVCIPRETDQPIPPPQPETGETRSQPDLFDLMKQQALSEALFTHSPRVQALESRIPASRWINPKGEELIGVLFDESGAPETVLYGLPAGDLAGDLRLSAPFRQEGDTLPYYEQNRAELERIFAQGEPVTRLQEAIPGSEWVQVREEGAAYVMGLIREGDTPLYLCYGVPASPSDPPPQGMEGCCQWLPESASAPQGPGYWMMYQDALTGEGISP